MCVCVCVRSGGSTHLQDSVFREVCAVDGVFHFVFAIKSAQRVWMEVAGDFLFDRQTNKQTINQTNHIRNLQMEHTHDSSEIQHSISIDNTTHPLFSISWAFKTRNILCCGVLPRRGHYSAAGHVIWHRKCQNTQQTLSHTHTHTLSCASYLHFSMLKKNGCHGKASVCCCNTATGPYTTRLSTRWPCSHDILQILLTTYLYYIFQHHTLKVRAGFCLEKHTACAGN